MANAGVKITANSQDYQNKMKEMVASMKSLGSEFSLTATQAKLTGDRFGALKSIVEGLTQKVELQKNIVKANAEQFERLSKNLDEQKTKHGEIAKKVDAAKKAYNESAAATGKNSEESQKLKKTLDQLNSDLTESERRVSTTAAALDNQKAKTDKSNIALLEMANRLKEVSQKLKDAKLDEFAAKCDKVATSAENVAKKTALISGAAAGIEIAAAKSALSFEDSMAKVSTVMDENVVSSDAMKKAILDLSNETGIAAEDIAGNVYDAISAGQETSDAVNFVRESTKLATAGFTESSASLDLLTTILNAYGLSSSEVNKVSDQLITTQNLGKVTVDELAGSMGKVIPTAKAFNVGLDNVNTSYVMMTSNGIKATESTTYLNALLNEVGKTGSITDKILREKTGKSFSDLMESGSSLGDVLAIVEQEANAQNKQFTDMFSSSEAAKAGLVLIKDGADGFNKTLGQMNDSTGATDSAFEKMQTKSFKLKLTFNEVKNALIDFGTSVLSALEPTLTKISTKVSELTKWFNNLDSGTKENIAKIGMLVAAFAPLALGVSKVAKGVSGAVEIYKGFRTAIAKIVPALVAQTSANGAAAVAEGVLTTAKTSGTVAQTALNTSIWACPITWIVVAIMALIAAVVLMYTKVDWFRNMINSFFEWIKPAVSAIVSFLSTAWNVISTVITTVWNAISNVVTSVMNAIWPLIVTAWNTISVVISTVMNAVWTVISTVWNAISNVISVVLGIIGTVMSTYWNIYSTIISTVMNAIQIVIQTVWSTISVVISTVMNVVWTVISTVWNAISNVISVVLGIIGTVMSTFWNIYSTIILTVMNAIQTIIQTVWNIISGIITTVMKTIQTIIQTVWNTISGIITTVMNAIQTVIQTVWNKIIGTVSTAVNGIKTTVLNVFNNVKNTISGVLNSISSTVSNVFNGIRNTISNVMNGAKSIISGSINAIKGFFNFNISWPKIKLPHFNIKGSFNPIDWLSDGLPKISVDWYAKGGIMTSPTIFGMNGNKIMAGGEAGAEAILPLSYFYSELSRIIDQKLGKIKVNAYFKVEAHTYIDDKELANHTAVKVNEIMVEEYEGAR